MFARKRNTERLFDIVFLLLKNTRVLHLEPVQLNRVQPSSTESWGKDQPCRMNGEISFSVNRIVESSQNNMHDKQV